MITAKCPIQTLQTCGLEIDRVGAADWLHKSPLKANTGKDIYLTIIGSLIPFYEDSLTQVGHIVQNIVAFSSLVKVLGGQLGELGCFSFILFMQMLIFIFHP